MQGVVDFLLLDILLTVLGDENGPCFWPSLLAAVSLPVVPTWIHKN